MAIDRGGLDYNIEIRDNFSAALTRFRGGLFTARQEFRQFKAELSTIRSEASSATQGLRELAAASRVAASGSRQRTAEARSNIRQQRQEAVQLRAISREQRRLTADAEDRINVLLRERQAVSSLVRAYRQLGTARRQAGIGAGGAAPRGVTGVATGGGARVPRAPTTPAAVNPAKVTQSINLLNQLGLTTDRASSSANRAFISFQRLFTVFVLFSSARIVVELFASMVREMITFNAQIEQAELGIASLFTAVGTVRDATGEAVDSVRGLAVAQVEARRQTALLRVEGLRTAATFRQLLETFQVAVAPGLQAGLTLDQIRKFTVQISQAATAIGLEQNQLAEEIRSILSGTIAARTTRIAVALGITNEDIRNAKEAGVLVDFLERRFRAFSVAGEEALNTFNAILSNLQDAIQLVLQSGGLEFFNELKDALQEIFDLVVTENTLADTLEPNPQAVAFVREIANGLRGAVAEARRLVDALDVQDILGFGRTIGQAIEFAARVTGRLIEGFIVGAEFLRVTFIAITDLIRRQTGIDLFDNEALGDTVLLIASVGTALLGIIVSVKILSVTFGAVSALLGIINTATTLWATLQAIVTGELFLGLAALTPIAAVIAGIAVAFAVVVGAALLFGNALRVIVSLVTGVNLSFVNTFRLLATRIVSFALRLVEQIKFGFNALGSSVKFIMNTIAANILRVIRTVVTALASASKLIPGVSAAAAKVLAVINAQIVAQSVSAAAAKKNIDNLRKERDARIALINLAEDLIANTIKGADQSETSLFGLFKRAVKFGSEEFKKLGPALRDALGLGVDLGLNLDQQEKEARALGTTLSTLPGIVSATAKETEKQRQELQKITDELQKAVTLRKEQLLVLGLQGNIQRQVLLSERATQTRIEAVSSQRQRELELLGQIRATQRERVTTEARIGNLSQVQQGIVNRGVALGKEILNTQKLITAAQVESSLAAAKVAEAQRRFDTEGAAAAQRQLDSATARERVLKQGLESQKEQANLLLQSTENQEISKQQAIELNALIVSRLTVAGREKALVDDLTAAQQQRLAVERQIVQTRNIQIQTLAEQQTAELEQQNRVAGVERENQLLIERARLTQNTAAIEAAAAQARLNTLTLENNLALERSDRQIQAIDDLIAETNSLSTVNALLAQRNELEKQRQITLDQNAEKIAVEEQQRDLLLQRSESDFAAFTQGIGGAVQVMNKEINDVFQLTLDATKQLVSSFADFASQAIVDAFDPTKDLNLKERIGRFLQQLAQQLISFAIRVAIIKSLFAAGIGGGIPIPGAGLASGGPVGFADGGNIPNKPAPARLRPRGLPSTDKVPIWATAGEFMMPVHTVQNYGAQVMEALRQGLIDPMSLRALAGIRAGRIGRVRASNGAGFQTGGLVSDNITAIEERSEVTSDPFGGSAAQISVASTTPQDMGRFFRGGRNAILDVLEENKNEVNARLRQ